MKVLIISTNSNTSPMPVMPLGACMIAESARRAGHTVRLLDMMFEKDQDAAALTEICANPPDVIGVSVRNIDNNDMPAPRAYYKDVEKLTRVIRSVSSAPIILGGPAVSIMPEAYLRLTHAAGAVAGPGENIFPDILKGLECGAPVESIRGLITLKGGAARTEISQAQICNNECRMPDLENWIKLDSYHSRMATFPVQTKRGCPFNCIYCTYSMFEGREARLFPAEETVERVKDLSRRGYKDIEFVDAVFNYPYSHALSICEGLTRADTGARLQTHSINPGLLDAELLKAMELAGFCGIGISAESGSDKALAGLKKNFSVAQLSSAAESVAASSLPCFWMFILGGPGETESTVEETLRFADQYVKPKDVVYMSQGLRIYPGTGLEAVARAEGVLSAPALEMLEPATYISPFVESSFIEEKINNAVKTRMNYINSDFMQMPLLKHISPLIHLSGLGKPMWKHTGLFRRSMRLIGANI